MNEIKIDWVAIYYNLKKTYDFIPGEVNLDLFQQTIAEHMNDIMYSIMKYALTEEDIEYLVNDRGITFDD